MTYLWLDSTGNNSFNRCLLKEHIKALDIKAKLSSKNMSMVVYPKLSPYILQNWIASFVNHSAIFSEQKIFAVKNVVIHIVHESCCPIIRVGFLLHFGSFSTGERDPFRVVDFDDFTDCTDTPINRQIIIYSVREILLIQCLHLPK